MITTNLSPKRSISTWDHNLTKTTGHWAMLSDWFVIAMLGALGIAVLAPVHSILSTWQPLILAGILCLWFVAWTISKRVNRMTYPSLWPLYLILGWLPVTLFVIAPSASTWQACGYLVLGILLYLTCLHQSYLHQQPARLTWLFLPLLVIGLTFSALLVEWKSEFRLFYLPIYDWLAMFQLHWGETIHANVYAGALILLLPLAFAQLWSDQRLRHVRVTAESSHSKLLAVRPPPHKWERLRRSAWWVSTGLMLTLVILTQSRGGYLGAGFALLMVTMLRWPRLSYGLPLLVIAPMILIQQMGFTGFLDLVGADNTFGGSDVRTIIWSTSLQALQDFTWTGIGIGAFRQVMPMLYPNPVIHSEIVPHAHNLLLQIGLDLGLPGLAAYITFYATMVGMAIAVLRRTRTPQATAVTLGATWDDHAIIAPPEVGVNVSTKRFMRQLVHLERTRQQHWALAAGCLAALVGMQVHGLLDAVTWGNKLAFIPWLIFAQITLLYRYTGDEQ